MMACRCAWMATMASAGSIPLDLNFNMYWDDNPEKLERFIRILDESDYICHQLQPPVGQPAAPAGALPDDHAYYRKLLGCPAEQSICGCYRVAEPGMFTG